MTFQTNSENNLTQKIKLWLLVNPQFNPYKFSFKKSYRMMTSRFRSLPNFIIIGVGRAGTTALYSYLIQHPSINSTITEALTSDIIPSDIHFFEYMISNNLQWYKSNFPILSKKLNKHNEFNITGESSSTYIYHPDVPKRIFDLLPKIKLIVILRNPIDKAYSTYYQQYRYGECSFSFEDAIHAEFERIKLIKNSPDLSSQNPDFSNYVSQNIIRHGIYADYLKNWLNIFDKNQILILNANDLKKLTKKTLGIVFNFLGVGNVDIENISHISARTYPPIEKSTRDKLIEFYKPHNARLNKLLNTNFEWDV